MKILSFVDAPFAQSWVASSTLVNTLLKAQVIHNSDREQQYGCLRRKESFRKLINNNIFLNKCFSGHFR